MKKIIAVLFTLTLVAVGCTEGSEAVKKDAETAQEQLRQFQEAQPVPIFNSSQLRQNLIEIQTAQANATATTSFFFNQGVNNPIHICPSIGFPIPGTYQLTAPEAPVRVGGSSSSERMILPQLESTGVYTGDTSATTVICIDESGRGYANWWEGYVQTVAGPATWNAETGLIEMTGAPTAEFSTGEE